jgi:hypothetical protein
VLLLRVGSELIAVCGFGVEESLQSGDGEIFLLEVGGGLVELFFEVVALFGQLEVFCLELFVVSGSLLEV